jgi:hypothetical protein
MTRKLAVLLVLTLAAAFLGFALLHATDNKARVKAEKEVVPSPAAVAGPAGKPAFNRNDAIVTDVGDLEGAQARGNTGGYLSQAFPPVAATNEYIVVRRGVREADNNSTWKTHVVNVAGGSVHMTFGIFDSVTGRNNNYAYQCYDPVAQMLAFSPRSNTTIPGGGLEPVPPASIGATLQNGQLAVLPSGRAVVVGRSNLANVPAGNIGTATMADDGACLGQLVADTVVIAPPPGNLPLDPGIVVLNETTWVAVLAPFNSDQTMTSSRTVDGGETWSAEVPVITSSFLGFVLGTTGDREGDGPDDDTIWVASQGCVIDSFCLSGEEEIRVVRSVNGGINFGAGPQPPSISASGVYEFPAYSILYNGGLAGMMVEDTFHCVWLDYANNSSAIPGGHVHHLAVAPDLSVEGPQKVADINLPFNTTRDNSAITSGPFTGGLGFGIWQHPTMAYKADSQYLYVMWPQPPAGPNGAYLDSTRSTFGGGRTYGNFDVFCCVSRNNGRSFDAPTNVTNTNNPGCTGPLDPAGANNCLHEFYISAAANADSNIWLLAQTNTLPGFQASGANDRAYPGQTTNALWNIMSDEWRLYSVPARIPVIVAACGALGIPGPSNVDLLPGGANESFMYELSNTGLAEIILDSVTVDAGLADYDPGSDRGLQVDVSAANIGEQLLELDDYTFAVTFNPSKVSPAGAGLRNGNICVWVHSPDPLATNFNVAINCCLPASVYVVPSFCVFGNDSIHSGAHASRLGTVGCLGCATPGPSGFNDGMFYAATSDGYVFETAPTWVYTDTAAHTNGEDGVRWYFGDQFFRCLRAYTVDSIPYGVNGGYNIYAKTVITGNPDSNFIAEVIWETCTDPFLSDFLVLTVKVANVSGVAQPNMILGATCDPDIPTGYNGVSTPVIRFGPHNLSYTVTHNSTVDGKTYKILTGQGIDTALGEIGDLTLPVGTGDSRLCTGNERFFGILCLPDGAASSSPVGARGAVVQSNRILSTGGFDDTIFVRNMTALGYHAGENIGDPFTGLDTFNFMDSCPGSPGGKGVSTDIGMTLGAKMVNFTNNPELAGIVSRYGMEGLAASLDTMTNLGASHSYSVIYVAGIADSANWIDAIDSALSWYNQNAGQQIGGDLTPWHRCDMNDDGAITGPDQVLCLNAAFLDIWQPISAAQGVNPANFGDMPSLCTGDANMDGICTGPDIVLIGNYAVLGTLPTPGYPSFAPVGQPILPYLMGCF